MTSAAEIVQFWRDAGPNSWFVKDETFDGRCRSFEAEHHAAARGEHTAWERDAEGALALLILLDQIPRNIFRKSPHAFATDGLAQAIAARALDRGFDTATDSTLRFFFYMPFEHSEAQVDQDRSVRLFLLGFGKDHAFLTHARAHREIIRRFGRFPYRNAAFGRESTPEEIAFLEAGGYAAMLKELAA
jgi:uncharacterized protein (DUF924 family)